MAPTIATRSRRRLAIIAIITIILAPVMFRIGSVGGSGTDGPSLLTASVESKSTQLTSTHGANVKKKTSEASLGGVQLADQDEIFVILSGEQLDTLRPPTDTLGAITRTGQRIFVAQSIKQIHHGVYKVEALASTPNSPSGKARKPRLLRFAFKTECRPAAKWHGQQGWGEVAAHRLLQMVQQHSTPHTGSEGRNFASSFMISDYIDEGVATDGDGDGNAPPPPAVAVVPSLFQNTISFSAGGILFVSPKQLKEVIHADQCGIMDGKSVAAWKTSVAQVGRDINAQKGKGSGDVATLRRFGLASDTYVYWSRFESLKNAMAELDTEPTVPLYGVFLTWNPNHKDDALPAKSIANQFALPNKAKSNDAPHADDPVLKQLSEILILDYILGNEDREDKNWFRGAVGAGSLSAGSSAGMHGAAKEERLIMMDNGWVFSGRNYKESMCGLYEPLILCPPLLRYATGSGKCKVPSQHAKRLSPESVSSQGEDALKSLQAGNAEMQTYLKDSSFAMCRFPKNLLEQLLKFLSAWVGGEASEQADLQGILPLSLGSLTARQALRDLLEKYSSGTLSVDIDAPLYTFWVSMVRNDLLVAQLLAAHTDLNTDTFNAPLSRRTGAPCGFDLQMRGHGPLDQVAIAIGRRMARAIRAAVDCAEAFGEQYTLLL